MRKASSARTGLRSFSASDDTARFVRFALAVVAAFALSAPCAKAASAYEGMTYAGEASSSKTPPCAHTSIASVRAPSGPAAYQHGTLRLKNGASVWIEGSSNDPGVIQAVHMKPGDAVAACYGPVHRYADAGDARAVTVLDLVTSGSYGNVVGSWPGAK